MKEAFLTPLLRRHAGALCIRNERSGQIVATQVVKAFDSKSRRAGLLSYDSFPDGHAMVIAPSNAVHTWFMRFAIDLAFVDKRGRVVKVRHAVKPWRLAAALRAYAVIELPVGALAHSDTVAGDQLTMTAQH